MNCSSCGSPMILRTAKKGKFAGQQFWGCSNFPTCKKIINISDQDESGVDVSGQQIDGDYQYDELNLPVFLQAREKFRGFQVRFFETLALPKTLFDKLNYEELNREDFNSVNKWRIDFPIVSVSQLESNLKQILLVAHKILTRGRITLLNPFIENNLKNLLGISNESKLEFTNLSFFFNHIKSDQQADIWLDGIDTEQKFYKQVLPDLLGSNYKKYVLPQVSLASLIDESIENVVKERVDFLICNQEKKIIVELDGIEHKAHEAIDNLRIEKIENLGYEVFRIENQEIHDGVGPELQNFITSIGSPTPNIPMEYKKEDLYCISTKLIHQIEISIIEALLNGHINIDYNTNILIDASSIKLSPQFLDQIIQLCQEDIIQCFSHLSRIYEKTYNFQNINISVYHGDNHDNSIIITYNDGFNSPLPKYVIQDISFPKSIASFDRPIKNAVLNNPDVSSIKYFLEYIFRHQEFLEGQLEAILKALAGEDAIVLLPTGAGKSVAFQLASLLLPGVTIVIDPILALIDDQLDNLQRVGIDRTIGITGQITDPEVKSKVISIFGQGEYLFCYIAPERFQTEEFRSSLKSLTVSTPVSLIVIDEAHCVSEWGHDFRTSYLNIGRTSREYSKYESHIPPLLALTGTASNSVLRDVQRELQIKDYDSIITPKTFNRKELFYNVFQSSSAEKFKVLSGILQRLLPEKFNTSASSYYQLRGESTNAGLIFCPHVGGSVGVVENSDLINNQLGIRSKFYAGKAPKNWNNVQDWNNYKRRTSKEFKNNKLSLLVATKAFGMGIDKPNIRYTIHLGLPQSIESFYQEVGRAGRDKKRAECILIISNDYPDRTQRILEPSSSIEEIRNIMDSERNWDNDDDITRAMFFHLNSFSGVTAEIRDLQIIINNIVDIESFRKENFAFQKLGRNSAEKCIHRLLLLGVISDYTINYANNEFSLRFSGFDKYKIIETYLEYVAAYSKGRVRKERAKIIEHLENPFNEFVLAAARILIEFIYDTIEKGRRRALREMLSLATSALEVPSEKSNSIVREGILNYLETSYSEEIEQVVNEVDSFDNLIKLVEGEVIEETGESFGGIRSTKDAQEIRGQVARYLESSPDHPGLLLLRSLSEIYINNPDKEIIFQNIYAAINFSINSYSIDKKILYKILVWVCSTIYFIDSDFYREFVTNIIYEINDTAFARILLHHPDIEESMLYEPTVYLLSKYSQEIVETF